MGIFFDRLVRVLIGSGGSDVVKHGVTFFYTTLSESCTGSPPRAPMRAGAELLTAEAHCSGVKEGSKCKCFVHNFSCCYFTLKVSFKSSVNI